jgi:hypothetical protein
MRFKMTVGACRAAIVSRRVIAMAPQIAKSAQGGWEAAAMFTRELAIAAARIADRGIVDMLVPVNFATAGRTMGALDAIGNASTYARERDFELPAAAASDIVARTHRATVSRHSNGTTSDMAHQ